MEKRTTLLLAVACAVALSASMSCGGKNPAEPTGGAANAPVGAASDDDEVSALANSTMRWSIRDGCPDGRGLQWRLFDIKTNKRYPATGTYRTPVGGVATKSISCTTGNKVCVGATTSPASSLSWGVGINGTRRNGAILRSIACRACGNVRQALVLLCFRRADGFAPSDQEDIEEDAGFEGFGAEESLNDAADDPFVE